MGLCYGAIWKVDALDLELMKRFYHVQFSLFHLGPALRISRLGLLGDVDINILFTRANVS